MSAQILVLGSSHTTAILRASKGQPNIRVLWVKNPAKEDPKGDITTEEALAFSASLSPNDILAITWLGTHHNIFGLLQHETPFDFYEPGSPELPDCSKQIIPYDALRDLFLTTIRTDKFVRSLAKATQAKTYILATPPVKGDQEFMQSKLEVYRGISVETKGITPANIRAKIWRLEELCLNIYCSDLGIKYLSAPDESLTEDGYLKPEFYHDGTHANIAYGAMVANQLYKLSGAITD